MADSVIKNGAEYVTGLPLVTFSVGPLLRIFDAIFPILYRYTDIYGAVLQANIPPAVLEQATRIAVAVEEGQSKQDWTTDETQNQLQTVYSLAHKVDCVVQAARRHGPDPQLTGTFSSMT